MATSPTALVDDNRLRLAGHISSGVGVARAAREIVQLNPGSVARTFQPQPQSFEERVFDALAQAKIWTSKVAMHMALEERNRYFRQLNTLHDTSEWFGEENPLNLGSYQAFIRFMLMLSSKSKPSLGLTSDGLIVAAWQKDGNRLTVEFNTDNRVQWVVSRKVDGQPERAAGMTTLDRLVANLAPYEPETWSIS